MSEIREMKFSDDLPTWAELRHAVEASDADAPRRWGSMSAPQMLRHVNAFCGLYMGEIPVSFPIRVAARWLGKFFLNRVAGKSPLATPKNMGTMPALRQAPTVHPNWAEELAQFLSYTEQFEAIEVAGNPQKHPMYGEMSARDFSGLLRHHTAHHFHQFGLLSSAPKRLQS